jgi:hypothetical protein
LYLCKVTRGERLEQMTEAAPSELPIFADAELMAIADACAEAGRAREAAADAAQEAEAQREPLAPPAALLKTQHDAELGLFDGDGVGTPYGKAEVELLRSSANRWPTAAPGESRATPPVQTRSSEIVSAWPAWGAALATCVADPALDAAADHHEDLLRRLLATPALTLDGVVAKARAFDSLFGDDAELARNAKSDFDAFGPNESVLARALARDLIRLARAAQPPAPPSRRPEA